MVETPLNWAWAIFIIFWSFLDAIFNYIEQVFIAVFTAIPLTAIPFLIGIFCYSIVAFFQVLIERQEAGNEKLATKIVYKIYVIMMILFTIWRFEIVAMLENRISIETLSEFFVNVVYIFFGIALIWSFRRKVPWLKKAILVLLWSCFLILTWVICPALQESVISENTLYQTIVICAIFVVPNSIYEYQQQKRSGA